MKRACLWVVCIALPAWALLAACGGQAGGGLSGDDGGGGDALVCAELPCAPSEVWNPSSCACERLDEGTDVGTTCPTIQCAAGSVLVVTTGGQCLCVTPDAGPPIDATTPPDAPHDAMPVDSPPDTFRRDAPEGPDGAPDAPNDGPPIDSPRGPDAPNDAPLSVEEGVPPDAPVCIDSDACGFCTPQSCGAGFEATPSCQCIACTNSCPLGEMPAAGCTGCVACTTSCPAGFGPGINCGCVPLGVDAGPPPPPDAGGVTCLLAGSLSCNAGSWCELGVCPDGKTQYGCFCNADGTANCQLSCPVPPPCDIPGEGTCPYGSQCVFGSCTNNPNGTALVCSCYGGGASCYTSPCGVDGGINGPDGGLIPDGGTTCLLEGYLSCAAGTFCELGICPDGTTPFGCTCNQDGTATCDLTCPASKPCTIPGEGTCPYLSTCTFGSCAQGGAELSCYCGSGGFASCYTTSCDAG